MVKKVKNDSFDSVQSLVVFHYSEVTIEKTFPKLAFSIREKHTPR